MVYFYDGYNICSTSLGMKVSGNFIVNHIKAMIWILDSLDRRDARHKTCFLNYLLDVFLAG